MLADRRHPHRGVGIPEQDHRGGRGDVSEAAVAERSLLRSRRAATLHDAAVVAMRLQQGRLEVARQRAGQDGLGERRPSGSDGPKGRQRRLAARGDVRSPDAANDVMATAAEQATATTSVRRLRPRRAADAEAPLDVPGAQRRHADGQQGEENAHGQAIACRPERPRGSGSANARDRVSTRSARTTAADPSRADEPATRPGDRRR